MPSLQAAIMFGRQRIGDRAEYLVANSPHAAGMTRALVSGIAGTGHLLNTRDPEIDRNFKRWSKRATVDGRSLASLQASVARDVVVRGEAFVVIRFVDGKILLQQIDPKQVDSSRSEELPGGSRIVAGVEIDTEGRRVAFWILPSRPGDPSAEVEPAKRVPADDVMQEVLFTDSLSIVARPGHPLAGVAPRTLADTLAFPWIAPPKDTPSGTYLFETLRIQDMAKTPVRIVSSSLVLVRGLMSRGDYVTIMSRNQYALEEAQGLLTPLPIPLPDSARPIGLITRAGWQPTATQARLLDLIRDYCRAAFPDGDTL